MSAITQNWPEKPTLSVSEYFFLAPNNKHDLFPLSGIQSHCPYTTGAFCYMHPIIPITNIADTNIPTGYSLYKIDKTPELLNFDDPNSCRDKIEQIRKAMKHSVFTERHETTHRITCNLPSAFRTSEKPNIAKEIMSQDAIVRKLEPFIGIPESKSDIYSALDNLSDDDYIQTLICYENIFRQIINPPQHSGIKSFSSFWSNMACSAIFHPNWIESLLDSLDKNGDNKEYKFKAPPCPLNPIVGIQFGGTALISKTLFEDPSSTFKVKNGQEGNAEMFDLKSVNLDSWKKPSVGKHTQEASVETQERML